MLAFEHIYIYEKIKSRALKDDFLDSTASFPHMYSKSYQHHEKYI